MNKEQQTPSFYTSISHIKHEDVVEFFPRERFSLEESWSVPESWVFGKIEKYAIDSDQPYYYAFCRYSGDLRVLPESYYKKLHRFHGRGFADFTDPIIQNLHYAGLFLPPNVERQISIPKSSRTEVWLRVNSICQLGCPHCFDGQSKPDIYKSFGEHARKMKPDTYAAIVEETINYSIDQAKKEVHYKIAGGEPTLTPDLIFDIVDAARSKAGDNIKTSFALVTNGIGLTDKLLEKLKGYGIHVALSFDGSREAHNTSRPFKNGKGSFDEVMSALGRIKDSGISHNISYVISRHNVDELSELATTVLDQYGWTGFSISFVRDNPFAKDATAPDNADLISGLQKFYQILYTNAIKYNQPIQRSDLLDYYILGQMRREVCGAGSQYLAYGPDGRMESCHMLLLSPKIGGRVGQGDPFELTRKSHPVPIELRRIDDRANGCTSCFQRHQCVGGGCQLHQEYTFGAWNPPQPFYCETYYTMGPEWMQLAAAVEYMSGKSIENISPEEGVMAILDTIKAAPYQFLDQVSQWAVDSMLPTVSPALQKEIMSSIFKRAETLTMQYGHVFKWIPYIVQDMHKSILRNETIGLAYLRNALIAYYETVRSASARYDAFYDFDLRDLHVAMENILPLLD